MTLLSRKNRRITASRARGRWTAISLGLAFAGGADAQAPVPSGPAPTVWNSTPPRVEPKPYPQVIPVAPPPAMPAVALPTAPAPAAPLTFQKPAGDRVPVAPAVRSKGAPVPIITVAQPQPKPAEKQPTPPADTPGTKPLATEAKPQDPKGMLAPQGKGPSGPAPALPTAPGALPNKYEVFRLDSDTELNRRILKDLGRKPEEAVRVPPAKLTKDDVVYQPKTLSYPPSQVLLEPNYIVHRRLYFEEPNSERYGWDAGVAQPLFSTLYFYRDTLLWPHNLAAGGCKERYDTSRGKCLPGDPVPYYLYPPGFTIGGSVAEAVVITGIGFIFP